MTVNDFKSSIEGKIPAKYLYISRNMYSVKGIPIYLIYFNSRIPNTKISRSVINKQHTLRVQDVVGRRMGPVHFSMPRQHDNRNEWIGTVTRGTHHPCKVKPVQGVHVPVANNNIGGKVPQFLESIRAIARLGDIFYAERMQNANHKRAHVLVVVNNQKIDPIKIYEDGTVEVG